MTLNRPTNDDIRAAACRIAPYVHRTPVHRSTYINDLAGAEVFFKCENFQKIGAFKFRGACNTVFSLSDEECARGVVTHSSGNHAQALALAANMRGVTARIVMPETAPAVKVAAVREYGADVTLCAPTLQAREEGAASIIAEYGSTMVHPYNDTRIIAGQGTCGLELIEVCDSLDAVFVPIGGGGLCSGVSIVVDALLPDARMIAIEPEGADDVVRAFQSGKYVLLDNTRSVADGLLTGLGDITWPIVNDLVNEAYAVSDDEILAAMRLLWERMKLVVEPSGATAFAGLLKHRDQVQGQRVGVVISGGNVDLTKPFW